MAELLINPIHNVHKKYREMIFLNPYINTPAPPITLVNTFIGGVGSTTNTPALLAIKLKKYPSGDAFSESDITDFSVIGDDIECSINQDYYVNSFYQDYNITSFIDNSDFCKGIVLRLSWNLRKVKTLGVLFSGVNYYSSTQIDEIILPLCTSVEVGSFSYIENTRLIYIPLCTNLGGSALNNGVFTSMNTNTVVIANPYLQTNNGGGVDGDLDYIIGRGNTVRYKTNSTVPNTTTNLSATSDINGHSARVSLTEPYSLNGVWFYEIYVNGILNNTTTDINECYAINLSLNTSYVITIKTVDILYNKSALSNGVNMTTLATNIFPISALLSYYKLEEISGSVLDSYGTSNGTNYGMTTDVSAKILKGYRNINSTTRVKFPTAAMKSFCFWINREATTGTHFIFDFRIGSTTYMYDAAASGVTKMYRDNKLCGTASAIWIPLNKWSFCYFEIVTLTGTAVFLNERNSAAYGAKGIIDEISFFNRNLKPHELSELYNEGNGITI